MELKILSALYFSSFQYSVLFVLLKLKLIIAPEFFILFGEGKGGISAEQSALFSQLIREIRFTVDVSSREFSSWSDIEKMRSREGWELCHSDSTRDASDRTGGRSLRDI